MEDDFDKELEENRRRADEIIKHLPKELFVSTSISPKIQALEEERENNGMDKEEEKDEPRLENLRSLPRIRKLSTFLDQDVDDIVSDEEEVTVDEENEKDEDVVMVNEDYCVECEVEESQVFCEQCHDYFCLLCFEGQHRKGNRKAHTNQPRLPKTINDTVAAEEATSVSEVILSSSVERSRSNSRGNICSAMGHLFTRKRSNSSSSSSEEGKTSTNMLERAKYIPVRLSYEERKQLRTLEAALAVSTYTNKLDTSECLGKSKRLRLQLQEICGFMSAMITGSNYNVGQVVLEAKNFDKNASYLQETFELGRRYKIMNPEKMRGEYGKLLYLLQDACSPSIEDLLGFSCHIKIRTVFDVLKEANSLKLLEDPLIEKATQVVAPGNKSRSVIAKEIAQKEQAISILSRSYMSRDLSRETIEQCLYSIGDNNYHLYFERDPIDQMISHLKTFFKPHEIHDNFSLAVQTGQEGARLSHNHERQYHYVLQSLTLWREVVHDMFRLWYLTDEDLLSTKENPYQLMDTGQGYHRVQPSPRVTRAMHIILHETQRRLQADGIAWVGSSVIHLGDSNVPNALNFIDKYAQIGHILRPILTCLKEINQWYDHRDKHSNICTMIDEGFGGKKNLITTILCDFFQQAFDGSGADNFFEAGSCIDGRLTSAWHWCSNLPTKRFYFIFKLSGFVGFDGKF